MKAKTDRVTKRSESEKVDAYMTALTHPLADLVEALRRIILNTDAEIGEEIKWNAPAFFYSGEMAPSDPKKYKRYIVVFNLSKKECVRLVFLSGAKVDDGSGFLEGDYADGRRLALFSGMAEVRSKKAQLQMAIRNWLAVLDKK